MSRLFGDDFVVNMYRLLAVSSCLGEGRFVFGSLKFEEKIMIMDLHIKHVGKYVGITRIELGEKKYTIGLLQNVSGDFLEIAIPIDVEGNGRDYFKEAFSIIFDTEDGKGKSLKKIIIIEKSKTDLWVFGSREDIESMYFSKDS